MKKIVILLGIEIIFFASSNTLAFNPKVVEKAIKGLERQVEEAQKPPEPPLPPANRAPEISNPYPYDGQREVATLTILSWTTSDPDGDPVITELFFGTTSPISRGIASSGYRISDLATATTYQWQVIARDSKGSETQSAVWRFTTLVPSPPPPSPPPPIILSPLGDKMTGHQQVFVEWEFGPLWWDCKFELFAGITSDNLIFAGRGSYFVTLPFLEMPQEWRDENRWLLPSTRYYFKVVALNNNGSSSTKILNFLTRPKNNPPFWPLFKSPLPNEVVGTRNIRIEWSGGDPDLPYGDEVTYTVRVNEINYLHYMDYKGTETSFIIPKLSPDTQYRAKFISCEDDDYVLPGGGSSYEGEEIFFSTKKE